MTGVSSPERGCDVAEDPKRTMFARQAIEASDMFAVRFRDERYGPRKRRMRLGEPDGPSTDGGRKARQPILLEGEGDAPRPVVIGFLDVARKAAELRSHDAASAAHEARHGMSLEVSSGEYQKLLGQAGTFLSGLGLAVTTTEAAPAPAVATVPAAVATPSSGRGGVFALGLGVGLLLGGALGYGLAELRAEPAVTAPPAAAAP